jgi:hypothetical protein
MKKLILLAFVLLPVLLSGQVLKGTGISYFDSIPNVAPSLPKGTEIALGIKTKKLYRWDRTCSCWIELETSTDSLARTVLASGLFNQYAVPFGGSTGKLDQSAAFQFVLGQLQANSFATLGSAGAGYVGLSPQSSVPATPSSGMRVYADASGRFGLIGTNGYTRVFDASGITANRIFKLQNKTYTLADSADVASLSASLPGAYFPLPGGTLTGTGGAGFVGFPAQSSAPSAPGAGLRVFANSASNLGFIRADGYLTTFDFSSATGNRFFTYPANAGTFGILENAQSWTGINTFAPTGTGAAGFIYNSTGRPSHPFGTVTTAQRDAMTGMAAGDIVYNSNLKRINLWDFSWLSVPTMASGGLGNGQIARGDASGNIFSSSTFTFDGQTLVSTGATTSADAINFRTGTNNIGFRIRGDNNDVTTMYFYDSGGSNSVVSSRPTYAGGIVGFGPSYYNVGGTVGTVIFYQGQVFMKSHAIGGGFLSGHNLNIAGAGQSTGGQAGGTRMGVTAGWFDIGTESYSSNVLSGTRNGIRFNASSFQFHPTTTAGNFVTSLMATIDPTGMEIGGGSIQPSAILTLNSTTKGLLIPRATNAQISAVSSPALALQMFSTDDERIHLKRTSGFYQIAYIQDVKRDTSYQITNTNLDISGQTTNFKNRYHTVRIATAVTAAATANNVITMPVPHADLLGVNFKVSVIDVSGDGDISQLSFGTDGVDGYLSNGDGTYSPTQNLYPGLGVYVSVAWDQNKSAYRWFLQ